MNNYLEKAIKEYKECRKGYYTQINLIEDADEQGRFITSEDISELKRMYRKKAMFLNKMDVIGDIFGKDVMERCVMEDAVLELLHNKITTTKEHLVAQISVNHNVDYDTLLKEFNNYLEGYVEIGN